ncbi:MAG: SurA N-terminal domain-containing protein [Candidatus Beckwithbacteria bacterium]
MKKVIKKIKLDKKWLKLAVVGLGAIGLLYYFKASLIVAWVNNQPLWKISYNQELNRLAGKQALESLMIKTMIKQEAKKQAVAVNQEELDGEIAKIEEYSQKQGMSLDDLLALQGVKKADLLEDLRLQKLVDKMAGTESAQVQEWITNLQTQAKVINWLKK